MLACASAGLMPRPLWCSNLHAGTAWSCIRTCPPGRRPTSALLLKCQALLCGSKTPWKRPETSLSSRTDLRYVEQGKRVVTTMATNAPIKEVLHSGVHSLVCANADLRHGQQGGAAGGGARARRPRRARCHHDDHGRAHRGGAALGGAPRARAGLAAAAAGAPPRGQGVCARGRLCACTARGHTGRAGSDASQRCAKCQKALHRVLGALCSRHVAESQLHQRAHLDARTLWYPPAMPVMICIHGSLVEWL